MRKADIRYFFVTPPLQCKELTVGGIGIREAIPPCIVDRPAGTGDILIMLFYEEVLLNWKKGIKKFPSNTLMIWHNGAGHYYGNKEKNWLHSWIHCKGRLVENAIRKAGFKFDIPIMNVPADIFEKYLYDLHFELTASVKPSKDIAGNILLNMMLEIARLRESLKNKSYGNKIPQKLRDVFYLLLEHHERNFKLEELAAMSGYSVPRFSMLFKQYFSFLHLNTLFNHVLCEPKNC